MEERIQKIISAAGITSRRAAETLITEGRVRVNGTIVTELGTKADPSKDHIKVDGKLINPRQPLTYLMLNKPAGFVTTMSDPEGRPTVQDLLKGVKTRVYPVGRLDYNTEGLLLMTNDGDFAHLITHPKHEFPKTYLAKVKGVLEDGMIDMLERGVFLQDGKTAPARIKKIRKEEANSWVEITIHEGKKRQVRRMFDHVGRSVIKLKRIKTGGLTLGDLPEGRFRHLTGEEVNALKETAGKTDETGQTVRVYKPEDKAKRPEPRAAAVPGRPVAAARRVEYRGAKSGERRVGAGGPRTGTMHDTRDGRRKNQAAGPGAGSGFSRSKAPAARAGFSPRTDTRYSRPSSGDTAASTARRRTSPEGSTWKAEAPRKPRPDSRAGSGFSRSKAPGARPGFSQRTDTRYNRPSSGDTAASTARRRTSPGGATWKAEAPRKPRPDSGASRRPEYRGVKSGERRVVSGGTRTGTMHDTRDGRRKNQAAGPGAGSGFSRSKAPAARAGFSPRTDTRYSRPSSGDRAVSTARPRTKPGEATWKSDGRRKPRPGSGSGFNRDDAKKRARTALDTRAGGRGIKRKN